MGGAVCKQTVKTLTRRRIFVPYGLGLHCLHTSHKKGARIVWAYSVWCFLCFCYPLLIFFKVNFFKSPYGIDLGPNKVE